MNRSEQIDSVINCMPTAEPAIQKIWIDTYRQLALGYPVSDEMIAENLKIDCNVVKSALDIPGVFRNDEQSIIGFWGLSIMPMKHKFIVEGVTLSTWCAWDALFIPKIVGKRADVVSVCPQSQSEIRLVVDPDLVENISPEKTVVSFLKLENVDDSIVSTFCHHVHFFSSPDTFLEWQKGHPDLFQITLDEAFDIGWKKNKRQFPSIF